MSRDLSQLAVGFRFRGVATESSESGSVWYRGGPEPADLPLSYVWEDRLVEIPGSLPTGTDFRTGAVETTDYRIRLHHHTDVAETFLDKAKRSSAELAGDISASDTTIPSNDSSLTNTTVYIGTETIDLTTYDSNTNEYAADRGRRGSTAVPHDSGDQIYTSVPYWRGRIVDLIYYRDDLGSEEIRWTGYVRDVATAESPTTLQIETGHVVERLGDARVGRDRTPINDGTAEWSEIGPSTLTLNPYPGPFDDYESQVRKKDDFSSPFPYVVDAEGGIYFLDIDQNRGRDPQFGTESEVDIPDSGKLRTLDPDRYQVYELAAFGDRIRQRASDLNVSDPTPTQSLSQPDHVASIALAFLNSTELTQERASNFDLLNGRWGLILRDVVDTSGIDTVISDTPSRTVDQWIWGWGGESEDVWSRLTQALRGHGFVWSLTQSGDLSISTFGVAGIREVDTQLSQKVDVLQRLDDHLLQREESRSSEVDALVVEYGNWPWTEPKKTTIKETGTPGRAQALAPGDTVTFDLGTVSIDNESQVRTRMLNRLRKHHLTMPRLSVRVPDPTLPGESGPSLDIGQYVALKDLGLASGTKHPVDSSGTRVEFDSSKVQWIGQIVAREHEIRRGTYKLELLLTNYDVADVVRDRAPSMEVTGDNSSGNDDKVYCASSSQFGADTSDNQTFDEGDRIQIVDRTGVRRGGDYEITSIGSDNTGDFLQISGTFGLGSLVDDFVRLSPYDDYEANNTSSTLTNLSVRWTYAGDSSENLGSDPDDAHIYGV